MLTENGMTMEAEARLLEAFLEVKDDISRGEYEVWHPGTFTRLSTQDDSKKISLKPRVTSSSPSMRPLRKSAASPHVLPV